jgi:predicted PurR-regulated permease PerM
MPVMSGLQLEIPARWQKILALLLGVALCVIIVDRSAAVVMPVLRKTLDILAPVLIAFAVAYLLDPLVDRVVAMGRSRNFGVAVVLGGFLLIAGLALVLVVPTVIDQVQNIGTKVSALSERASERVKDGETLKKYFGEEYEARIESFVAQAKTSLESIPWERVIAKVSSWMGGALESGYHVALGLVSLLLVPVLTVYLLKDIDRIIEAARELVPPPRREAILGPLREVDLALSQFVRGQLMVATCLGVLYSIGLVATGTPMGLTIGLFAGAVSFIPYLGLVLGLVPALALNLIEHGSIPLALGVIATFVIAQFLEGNFITPKIVGESMGLHPVIVIMAVIAGGSFFGLGGMLLALPIVAAGMVFARRIDAKYRASKFYTGEEPGPEPEPSG